MAIKAQSQITLSCVVDVAATYRYYLLQASTLSPPDKPTKKPPGGSWSDAEPSYTSGSTNTLYFVDLTVFSNGTWAYSSVSKSSAYEAAKEAYNKAQKVTETVDGLTKIQDGDVLIDGDKVYLSAAFVKSIFAQDITATGTIKGGTLKGTEIIGAILKGGAINISGTYDNYTGRQTGYIKTQKNEDTNEPELVLGVGEVKVLIRYINDGASPDIILDAPCISIGPYGEQSETTVYNLTVDGNLSGSPDVRSYTNFSGGIISSGTINVVKYLGWCHVFGEFKLSAAVSNWTQVLSSSQVPDPIHGINIYPAATHWGTSFVRAPRIQINGSGGLSIRYGAAATYDFSVAYPI